MTKKHIDCPRCGQNLLLGANTTEILDALKERAERVLEGEEWDLAEYILRKHEEVYSEPVHQS